MKAIITSLLFGLVMCIKKPLGWVFYPFAYLAKDWVYGNDVIKNYTMPKGVQDSWVKWCFWVFLDDDQPTGYPEWYAKELIGYEPTTKWDKFKCAYAWSGWRNSAFNINYYYLSTQSPIVSHKVVFGKHQWNKKLRASNGDDGVQYVTFKTQSGKERFIFSIASHNLFWLNIPLTFYYGFNPDTNGRFTIALKFK